MRTTEATPTAGSLAPAGVSQPTKLAPGPTGPTGPSEPTSPSGLSVETEISPPGVASALFWMLPGPSAFLERLAGLLNGHRAVAIHLSERTVLGHHGLIDGALARCHFDGPAPVMLRVHDASQIDCDVAQHLCASEKECEREFPDHVVYLSACQTETLPESIYAETYEEMLALGRENNALIHPWEDDVGRCLSMVDMQRYQHEAHAQCYHMIASAGLVLKTQSIFELRGLRAGGMIEGKPANGASVPRRNGR